MDKSKFLIETHLRTGRPIGELATTHGVGHGWLCRLLARYRPKVLSIRATLAAPEDLTHTYRRSLRGRDRGLAQALRRGRL